jgi:hypothetical protein
MTQEVNENCRDIIEIKSHLGLPAYTYHELPQFDDPFPEWDAADEAAVTVAHAPLPWTYTYMQRNKKRINNNHYWMEYNTSGGMDELVTWIKGPTFHMDNVQLNANCLGRATPHFPSHNGY